MQLPRGRIVTPPEVTIRRLTVEDLATLREPRAAGPRVQRFRDSHHRVARLVALGLRPRQIMLETGYSLQRIYTLQSDPTFQHLVDKYRAKVDEAYVASQDTYYEYVTSNMVAAERQIRDRLDEADELGETLPIRELIAISRDAADRAGYGKRSTSVNVNVDFAAQLERAIKRSGKSILGNGVVELPVSSPPEPAQSPSPLPEPAHPIARRF